MKMYISWYYTILYYPCRYFDCQSIDADQYILIIVVFQDFIITQLILVIIESLTNVFNNHFQ